MERDGTGHFSTIYTYGNQRINTESYNNLGGLYIYDGRGSVSSVIGSYGDFRATYWYDGLGNVKSQIYGYGVFGSGKKYYGYNAESYNPVTSNQNLRARQVNIRRQRFLTEDTYLGTYTETLSINRYIYGNDNPLKYKDPSENCACFGNNVNSFVEALSNYRNQALNIFGDVKNILFGDNVYENLGRYVGLNDTDAIASFVYRKQENVLSISDTVYNTGFIQNFFEKQSVVNTIYNLIDWQTGKFDNYSSFKTTIDSNGNKIVTTK